MKESQLIGALHVLFRYVSEPLKADIKAAGFFMHIHIVDLNAKSSLGGENGQLVC